MKSVKGKSLLKGDGLLHSDLRPLSGFKVESEMAELINGHRLLHLELRPLSGLDITQR